MRLSIGEIAEKATIVTSSTKSEEAYNVFKETPSLEGIVVCEQGIPIGLVTKTHFYQALSTKYGFNLFMNRTIDLVMDRNPLIVDFSLPITDVSALAMDRPLDHLYDYVIVTLQETLYGIVTIRNLLMKLTEVQVNIAQHSNPLTGLPGNFVIKETLQEFIVRPSYSVLYIDIDSFKFINDTYGFREGDELIKATGNIIVETLQLFSPESGFIGHIGGDDFIAAIDHYDYKKICQTIINRFDTFAKKFYSNEDWLRGYVPAINRSGQLENVPLVSVSIAVISNKKRIYESVDQLSKEAAMVKKRCKRMKKSNFLSVEDWAEESADTLQGQIDTLIQRGSNEC